MVTVGGPRPRALLALLLLDAGRVVSIDRLIDGLYGEEPPKDAGNALQAQVSRLRRRLGAGLIELRPAGYRLGVDQDNVDVHRFSRLASAGRQALAEGEYARAVEVLEEALALWRGPALADVTAPFAESQAARLEELRITATEERAEAGAGPGAEAGHRTPGAGEDPPPAGTPAWPAHARAQRLRAACGGAGGLRRGARQDRRRARRRPLARPRRHTPGRAAGRTAASHRRAGPAHQLRRPAGRADPGRGPARECPAGHAERARRRRQDPAGDRGERARGRRGVFRRPGSARRREPGTAGRSRCARPARDRAVRPVGTGRSRPAHRVGAGGSTGCS
jgi:Bacterial transcriptional activator domain/Transcriptional regulatory protein, C terminal